MKPSLDRAALFLSLAGAALGFVPGYFSYALALSLISLVPAGWQIALRPKRAFYIVGFAFLGLTLILLEWPLPPQTAESWVTLALLALQARLFLIGRAEQLELVNKGFSRELSETLPENSLLFIDNDIETITPTASLHADHIVRVQSGEVLPADGIVSFGSGFTEEILITGDPEPATKGMGKAVFAGSRNKSTTFLYRVVNANSETLLLRKAKFLKRGFRDFPLVGVRYLLVEVLAFFSLVTLHLAIEDSTNAVLGVWLASLGAIYAAAIWSLRLALVKRSAASGVIFRSMADLKTVANARSLVTDPEGSVMEGTLRLSGVGTDEALGEAGALRLAAPLARRIESPAAYCLLKELRIRNIPLELMDNYFPSPGGGTGSLGGEEIRWVDEATAIAEEIPYLSFRTFLSQEMKRPGASAHLLLREGKVVAAFAFVDAVRASSSEMVAALHRAGLSLILISPARQESVEALAQEIGVTHFQGEAGPKTSFELLEKLKREGLAPLWLDNAITPLPAGKSARILTPLAKTGGEATTARWDLPGALQVIRLARGFQALARSQFVSAIFLQFFLTGVCIRWPLWGAAGAVTLAAGVLALPVSKMSDHHLP